MKKIFMIFKILFLSLIFCYGVKAANLTLIVDSYVQPELHAQLAGNIRIINTDPTTYDVTNIGVIDYRTFEDEPACLIEVNTNHSQPIQISSTEQFNCNYNQISSNAFQVIIETK